MAEYDYASGFDNAYNYGLDDTTNLDPWAVTQMVTLNGHSAQNADRAAAGRADAPRGYTSSGFAQAVNTGGGVAANAGGDYGLTAYQQASLNLQQQQMAQQNAQFNAQLAQSSANSAAQLGYNYASLGQNDTHFQQSFGLQQQQVQGTPIDWARLGLQSMGMTADDSFRWAQLAQQGNAQAQNLLIQGYGAYTNANVAQAGLGIDYAKLGLQGYQISTQTDIAARQQQLAEQLGMGDQIQGFAKLQLASEANDISKLVSQAQIDQMYASMGLQDKKINADIAIEQMKAQLEAQSIAAQAAGENARAQAAMAQAQAALRGVEVQLQLGNGNLQLGRDTLAWTQQQGLADLDLRREQLGEKAYIDTQDLALRQSLGQAQIGNERYLGELQSATQRYGVDVGAASDIYRAQLAAALEARTQQNTQRMDELKLLAGLRGPADYFQYLKVLHAANPEGTPGAFAALANGTGLNSFGAPGAPTEPVSLGSFFRDTGIVPPPQQDISSQFAIPNAPTMPSFSFQPTQAPTIGAGQPGAPASFSPMDWMQFMPPGSGIQPTPITPGNASVPPAGTPSGTGAAAPGQPASNSPGTAQQVSSTDAQGRVRVGVLDPQGNFVPTDGLGAMDPNAPAPPPPATGTMTNPPLTLPPGTNTPSVGPGGITGNAFTPPQIPMGSSSSITPYIQMWLQNMQSLPPYQTPTPPQINIPNTQFPSLADFAAMLRGATGTTTPATGTPPAATTPSASGNPQFDPFAYVQQQAAAQGVSVNSNGTPPASTGGGGSPAPPASPGGSGGTPAPAAPAVNSIEAMNAAHPWAPPITQAIIDSGMSPDNYFAMYAGNSPTPPTSSGGNSNPVPDTSGGIYNFSAPMNYWDYIRLGGAPPAVPIPGRTKFSTTIRDDPNGLYGASGSWSQQAMDQASGRADAPHTNVPANGQLPGAQVRNPGADTPYASLYYTGAPNNTATNLYYTQNQPPNPAQGTPDQSLYYTGAPGDNSSLYYNSQPSDQGVYPEYQGIYGAVQSYDTGTNYVPQDQLAVVHEGEAIVPADQNPSNPHRFSLHNTTDPMQQWNAAQATAPSSPWLSVYANDPEKLWQMGYTPWGTAYGDYGSWAQAGGYDATPATPTFQAPPSAGSTNGASIVEPMQPSPNQVQGQPPHATPQTAETGGSYQPQTPPAQPPEPVTYQPIGPSGPSVVPGSASSGANGTFEMNGVTRQADQVITALLGGLPSPSQIPYATWLNMHPSEQAMVLGAYEAKGWDKQDVLSLILKSGQFGSVIPGNQYAAVLR